MERAGAATRGGISHKLHFRSIRGLHFMCSSTGTLKGLWSTTSPSPRPRTMYHCMGLNAQHQRQSNTHAARGAFPSI